MVQRVHTLTLKPSLSCLKEGDYSAAELTEALLLLKVGGWMHEVLQPGQNLVVCLIQDLLPHSL